MNRLVVSMLVVGVAALSAQSAVSQAQRPSPPATVAQPATPSSKPSASRSEAPKLSSTHQPSSDAQTRAAAQTALVKQYCTSCHNDRTKAGQLTLAAFDASKAADSAPIVEKMIRKLRAGMMPPAGAKRPDGLALTTLAAALETRIDRAAVDSTVGRRSLRMLSAAVGVVTGVVMIVDGALAV